jgi:hypothetical protein
MKPREFIFPLRLGGGMSGRGVGAEPGNAGESDYANPVSCKLSTRSRSRAVSS